MYQPTDGPAISGALSVLDSSSTEVKVGGSALLERKIVTIQPQNGKIFYGYDSGVTSSTGTLISNKQLLILEVSDKLPIYIISNSGTVDVRITEVA